MSQLQRCRMLWLVQSKGSAAGQMNRGEGSPARFRYRTALNSFVSQFAYGGAKVIAHQVKFMMWFFMSLCGVDCKFSGRCGKDQPAMASVNRFESQHIAQESTNIVRIRRV